MTDKKIPKRRNRNPHGSSRLSDEQLCVMGELFPGFPEWYRQSHDSEGKVLPSALVPGTPAQYEPEEERK
jgi:hypothetical protein